MSEQTRVDVPAWMQEARAARAGQPRPEMNQLAPPRDELLDRLKREIAAEPSVAASVGRRFAGGLVDVALVGLVNRGLTAFLQGGASPYGPSPDNLALGALLITSVIAAGYFIGCWMLFGATLGMKLAGIEVADARSLGPISGRQAWRRFVVLYLIGSLAFLVMLFGRDPKRRTWYDRAGDTVVLGA